MYVKKCCCGVASSLGSQHMCMTLPASHKLLHSARMHGAKSPKLFARAWCGQGFA